LFTRDTQSVIFFVISYMLEHDVHMMDAFVNTRISTNHLSILHILRC